MALVGMGLVVLTRLAMWVGCAPEKQEEEAEAGERIVGKDTTTVLSVDYIHTYIILHLYMEHETT